MCKSSVIKVKNSHPFGMVMPGRQFHSASGYRYGFNGMEKDDEIKGNGNQYTTFWRQYDPRLGRWMSIDPMISMFPWQSPYVAFDNNPINLNDPKGGVAQKPEEQDPPSKPTINLSNAAIVMQQARDQAIVLNALADDIELKTGRKIDVNYLSKKVNVSIFYRTENQTVANESGRVENKDVRVPNNFFVTPIVSKEASFNEKFDGMVKDQMKDYAKGKAEDFVAETILKIPEKTVGAIGFVFDPVQLGTGDVPKTTQQLEEEVMQGAIDEYFEDKKVVGGTFNNGNEQQ